MNIMHNFFLVESRSNVTLSDLSFKISLEFDYELATQFDGKPCNWLARCSIKAQYYVACTVVDPTDSKIFEHWCPFYQKIPKTP